MKNIILLSLMLLLSACTSTFSSYPYHKAPPKGYNCHQEYSYTLSGDHGLEITRSSLENSPIVRVINKRTGELVDEVRFQTYKLNDSGLAYTTQVENRLRSVTYPMNSLPEGLYIFWIQDQQCQLSFKVRAVEVDTQRVIALEGK